MAKKDKKNSKKKDDAGLPDPGDVIDAVRGAAQRIRESFDDLRVLEDVRGLRAEVEALSRRVAELERQAAKPASTPAAPARSARSGAGTARKAPAKPSAARTAAAKTGPKPKPAAR